ncbi:MAG TPA: hypothetical protein VJ508_13145, partial [Saprospiraceae bacterium]|nr:hypothetical protein [Saprospiraceae bacterium]
LTLDDQNYFTATEIAHLKPLYNIGMFIRYMNANVWIRQYFPNYRVFALSNNEADSRRSVVQMLLEFPLMGRWVTTLDKRLMIVMKRVWEKRYPEYDATTRDRIFRCTPTESCAYVGNFSDKILALYGEKLNQYNLKL